MEEVEIQRIKAQLAIIGVNINERHKVLPLVSSLCAASVAIFGINFYQNSLTIKIILTVLLIMIPLSLFVYNYGLREQQKKSFEIIKKIFKENGNSEILKEFANLDKGIKNKILIYSPEFFTTILAIVLLIFVFLLWRN